MRPPLAILLALGIATAKGDQEWETVAGISGGDQITIIHISNLLASRGITTALAGSVMYNVSVPKDKAPESKQILRADAKAMGYYIRFGENDEVQPAEAKSLKIDKPASDLLALRQYGTNTSLGLFLRDAEISGKLRRYPFVHSLRVQERPYLAATNKTEIGYEVEIELRPRRSDESKGYRGWFQVWDGGKRVQFQGSNEWHP